MNNLAALGLKHGGHRLYLWRIISIIAGNICNKINQQGENKIPSTTINETR